MVLTYLLNESHTHLFRNLSDVSQSQNLSNVRFITQDGEVFCQKLFLLSAFPFLKDWLCDFCYLGHQDIMLLLVGVSRDHLQQALNSMFSGNTEQMLHIFGFLEEHEIDNTDQVLIKEEVMMNDDEVVQYTNEDVFIGEKEIGNE